ncbi:MAG: endo-1,4-beta-xylanase [Treponema sp.]|nr:endo-1,4-beta-xylanase [Treponema sp.]
MRITDFLLLAALPLILTGCSSAVAVPGSTLTSGFWADAPSYKIVNLPLEGRQNVIRVNGADTNWAIVKYSLEDYKGKEITIQFSADVKRTGAAGTLNWQVNNAPGYPTVSFLENAAPGVWHRMRGRRIITPADDNPVLYLTNWENNAKNTIYYIDNIIITIEEGNSMAPNLALAPLKSSYENDFLVGNIIGSTYISENYFDLLKHHYSVVTPTETYPFLLAPYGKGNYQWEMADTVVNLARSNNMKVHGHVLAWHELCPEWMTAGSRETVISNLEQYIADVLSHFKGRITSWDVVNEAMRDNLSAADAAGDWRRCIRNSDNPWHKALGADYVEIAFRAARAADPDITLYYNDYFHYEWSSEKWFGGPNKPEAVRKMIDDINTRYRNETSGTRNLIEGVGTQSHFMGMDVNLDNVRLTLEKFKTLGIEIAVSELDISTAGYVRGEGADTPMSVEDEMAQARIYANLFKLYREYAPHISRVIFWGMDDGTSWLSAGNPCLFDWKLHAKKAFHAVSDPLAWKQKLSDNSR